MLISLALILLFGLLADYLFRALHLPGLLGMLLVGVLLGPFCFGLIDSSILAYSSELRRLALVIILIRAGLSLHLDDFQKIGRPAVLVGLVPSALEIFAICMLAPWLMGISLMEAAVLGAVLSAVSPAIVIPFMLDLSKRGYGRNNRIPQLLATGAGLDIVWVLLLFQLFFGAAQGISLSGNSFITIPISVISGAALGIVVTLALKWVFSCIYLRDTVKALIILCTALLISYAEGFVSFPLSGLTGVMAMGIGLSMLCPNLVSKVQLKFSKLWIPTEIMLFVLVGAMIDTRASIAPSWAILLVLFIGLLFRSAGVWISLMGTHLLKKEKLFCMVANIPKATVQATVGSMVLSSAMLSAHVIFIAAILAIVVSAPLGAIGMKCIYKKCLSSKP